MNEADNTRARFVAGMSHAAQTVNVVTTDGPAGRAGVTVSAMTSVSADTARPTLLVCVHRDSSAAPAILENGIFCVNMLRDDQAHVSDIFAGRHQHIVSDKFEHGEWTSMPSGAPRIADPLVAFDCRLVSADLVGTHHVFFGEVDEVFIARDGSPLIYTRRRYRAAAPISPAPDTGRNGPAHAHVVLACTGELDAPAIGRLLSHLRDRAPDLSLRVIEGDAARVASALETGKAELALTCSDGDATDFACEPLAELTAHAFVPAGDPLAAKAALMPDDLAGRPLILHGTPQGRICDLLRAEGIKPRIAGSTDSVETIRAMVAEGLGIGLVTCLQPGDGGGVLHRPLGWAVPPARLMLVWRDGSLSPAAARFADLCREATAIWGN